jgi:hypothetical protein
MPYLFRLWLPITLLFWLLHQIAAAQYTNQPVSLTTANDEVKQGYFQDYDWAKKPDAITFTDAKTQQVSTLPISSIRRMARTDGVVYEGHYLRVPYYSAVAEYQFPYPIDHIDSTYFLTEALLLSQTVKLFRFQDGEGNRRFAAAKNDSLVLLDKIQFTVRRDGVPYQFEHPAYKDVLKTMLNDCPSLGIDKVFFSEVSFIRLFKMYMACGLLPTAVQFEQRKHSTTLIGLGVSGSLWPNTIGSARVFTASLQLLLPGKFYNSFILVEGGVNNAPNLATTTYLSGGVVIATIISTQVPRTTRFAYGLYVGKYLGKGAIQAKLYTGISNTLGFLDTGAGISFRKIISAEVRYPLLNGFLSGFTDDFAGSIQPMYTLRTIYTFGRKH